jgi:hypothetical protein
LNAHWKGKTFSQTGQFQHEVSTEPYLLLRTMALGTGTRRDFDSIAYRELPALVTYPMFFEVLGDETVTVPAGTFHCNKVLFTVNDWRRLFFSAVYYITDDEKRWIVKVELHPFSGGMELVSEK